jgi:hypothetical protein
VRVTNEDLYVGRVVPADHGPTFMAFRNRDEDGEFVGGLTNPVDVAWRADGAGLEAASLPERWRPSAGETRSLG